MYENDLLRSQKEKKRKQEIDIASLPEIAINTKSTSKEIRNELSLLSQLLTGPKSTSTVHLNVCAMQTKTRPLPECIRQILISILVHINNSTCYYNITYTPLTINHNRKLINLFLFIIFI